METPGGRDAFSRPDDAGEGEHVDGLGAAAQERARGGVGGGAGGHHVVDEEDALARQPRLRLGRHPEGALQVLAALRPGQARPGCGCA